MHLLILRLAADMDINSRLVFFLHDIDMAAVSMTHCHTVQPQIIRALLLKSVGINHLKHVLSHLIKLYILCLLIIQPHRAHLLFVSCTRRNPVPDQTASA